MKLLPILALAATVAAATGAAKGDTNASRGAIHTRTVYANLDANEETPSPDGAPTGAKGAFTGSYNSVTHALSWRLTWVRVSEPTTEAQIRYGAAGENGPIALTLCTSCRSPVAGHKKISSELARAILQPRGQGHAYVNVDTERNKQGEIRGELFTPQHGVDAGTLERRTHPPTPAGRRAALRPIPSTGNVVQKRVGAAASSFQGVTISQGAPRTPVAIRATSAPRG